MAIYVTSDLHLGHDQPFIYEDRGFDSIQEHDTVIIDNWNHMIGEEDTVYVLGDLVLGDLDIARSNLKKLNGKINLIFGNHDDNEKKIKLYKELGITILGYSHIIKTKRKRIYLSHYPTIVGCSKNFFCLCGHTHTKNKYWDLSNNCIHVEVDAWDNKPVSLEQILEAWNNRK